MNNLKCGCLLVLMQEFNSTNTLKYTNIPSCRGKLVSDSSRLQEGIVVYALLKLYNKANLSSLQIHVFDILVGSHSVLA